MFARAMRFYPALDDVNILAMPVKRFFALVRQIPKLQAEEDLRGLMLVHNPYSKQPQRLVDMLKRQINLREVSSTASKTAKQRLKAMAGVKGFEFVTIIKKEPKE